MLTDVHHADGCNSNIRPSGHDLFTVLSWPHALWDSQWGGSVEFIAQECGGAAMDDRRISARIRPVLSIEPRPDRIVVFSSPLLHRTTHPTASAPLSAPPAELRTAFGAELGSEEEQQQQRWRFELVQQLSCPTGRDPGPYEDEARRWYHSRLVQTVLSAAVAFVLCSMADVAHLYYTARRRKQAAPDKLAQREADAKAGNKRKGAKPKAAAAAKATRASQAAVLAPGPAPAAPGQE
jgi:hypothetical protein